MSRFAHISCYFILICEFPGFCTSKMRGDYCEILLVTGHPLLRNLKPSKAPPSQTNAPATCLAILPASYPFSYRHFWENRKYAGEKREPWGRFEKVARSGVGSHNLLYGNEKPCKPKTCRVTWYWSGRRDSNPRPPPWQVLSQSFTSASLTPLVPKICQIANAR